MRVRLFLSFALIVLVSVASVVIVARQTAVSEVRTFMFRGGMSGTEGLAGMLEDYYQTHHSWQGAESLMDSAVPGQGRGRGQGMGAGMGAGPMGQRLLLADSQGNVIVDTGGADSSSSAVSQLSQSDLQLAIPLSVDDQVVGYLLPEGGANFTQRDEALLVSRLSRGAIIAGLIAGAVSLLLALFLAYRLLRPVRELTHAAARLGEGDLSQRVPVRGDDELAGLGQTFNRMADSLQRSEESRKAMTADIAHELRNPLAVQRANLEALQDGVYDLTPENLVSILEQNHLLTRLVEDLRTLALADAGQLELEYALVDFPALVRRVMERYAAQAVARQIDIRLNSSDACQPISLDPGRVEQILGNLLSNALRYTPPAGKIDLEITCSPSSVHLTLHDSGPGIPADALPHVFERFYRADRARTRSEGGTGLGLAIARQIAQAHEGKLEAANHASGGALFTLILPYREGLNRSHVDHSG
jgi:signal transduction histidine kinase